LRVTTASVATTISVGWAAILVNLRRLSRDYFSATLNRGTPMTRATGVICAVALALGLMQIAQAEGPAEAMAVVDKAVKALGGEKKLSQVKAFTLKSKGTLSFGGSDNEFTSETVVQGLDHVRAKFQADFNGSAFEAVTVVSGDKGWRKFGDMEMEIDDEGLANEKRMLYLQVVPAIVLPLKGKEFQVELGGEEQVAGKPAVGLKVTAADKKTFTIYFDKDSGLPVKEVAKVVGFMNDEFAQETTFSGYKEIDGIKKATKIESKRDGEKFISYDISEFKPLEKTDPNTFKKPD
jgi:hypothetical protein